jgi:hypothetical protein
MLNSADSADSDDAGCQTILGVGVCGVNDLDHDGTSYRPDWPDGSASHPDALIIGNASDLGVGPLSFAGGSYRAPYGKISFVPGAIEANIGSSFYPFFSQAGVGASCVFNFGNDIPGVTTNDFGKTVQYGLTLDNPCVAILADVNRDGNVDCADLALVRASFGKRMSDIGFDARADVNGDGVVDVKDLAFVAQNLPSTASCPTAPGPDLLPAISPGQQDSASPFCAVDTFHSTLSDRHYITTFSVENQGTTIASTFNVTVFWSSSNSGGSEFIPNGGSLPPGESKVFTVAISPNLPNTSVNFVAISVGSVPGESNVINNVVLGLCPPF